MPGLVTLILIYFTGYSTRSSFSNRVNGGSLIFSRNTAVREHPCSTVVRARNLVAEALGRKKTAVRSHPDQVGSGDTRRCAALGQRLRAPPSASNERSSQETVFMKGCAITDVSLARRCSSRPRLALELTTHGLAELRQQLTQLARHQGEIGVELFFR